MARWRSSVHPPDQARHLTDLRRAVAGTGPIRRAEIEGHADQRDVEPGIAGHIRGAHKGRGLSETRNHGGIEGLELWLAHAVVLLAPGGS